MTASAVLCADVGSTYTKVAAVDSVTGELYGIAAHRTTIDTDVVDGLSAARLAVSARLPDGVDLVDELVCSSAGGGLRLGVVGNEPLVTATAAHRAGLSAGAKVVAIAAADIGDAGWRALAESRPDVLLLAGGTDGGDSTVLLDHARQLAAASSTDERLRVPVVSAGNAAVATEVAAELSAVGLDVITVDNVLPLIGRLNPGPARHALREAFLEHVIAGKQLSTGDAFSAMVRSATPDAVLTGVELFADGGDGFPGCGDVVVVDVGGATTDVYSVLTPDAELSGPRREVAGTAWRSRTVEGDLGLRHTAGGIVAAARDEGLLTDESLVAAAEYRGRHPGWLPDTDTGRADDLRLTRLAIMVALRRHARGERLAGPDSPLRGGKNLRAVALIIGSGGVLRNQVAEAGPMLAEAVAADTAGGYPLPDDPSTVVDVSYVLGAGGLLAEKYRSAALALMNRHLTPTP